MSQSQNLFGKYRTNVAGRVMLKRIVRLLILLIFLLSLFGSAPIRVQATTVTFTGEELLGKPTDSSITINIVPDATIEYYYEYGTSQGGPYTMQTSNYTAAGGQPHEVVISGLNPNTRYYYRMIYDGDGDVDDGNYEVRDEHSFHTQRAQGSSFTFTITSDSHINILLGDSATWQQTLSNVADDNPDFNLDLGDTFAMDNVTTVSGAEQAYLLQRSSNYFGRISPSAAIYLAIGNHEQEEAWHLDDTGNPATSQTVMGANARKDAEIKFSWDKIAEKTITFYEKIL